MQPAGQRARSTAAAQSAPSAVPSASASQVTGSAPTQAAGPDLQELEQLSREADRLAQRAEVVNGTLDSLRQAQQSKGYGLRGDMAESQQRMKADLESARAALQAQDAARAKQYLGQARSELGKLEAFVGR
jgi:predicted  nucleic acid-binding Zn-ribbon protein